MTRTTNARLAGSAFLFYIAVGITGMVLSNQAVSGAQGPAAKLASMAQHATLVRLNVVLTLFEVACAVVLAVTLYALTRDTDPDLALLGMCCRLTEGILGAVAAIGSLQTLSVAIASTAASPGAEAAQAFGTQLLQQAGASLPINSTCFAAGSTIFSYLFLRARSIPVWLAWLGVFASVLLVVILPAQIVAGGGRFGGTVAWLIWMPMLVFEVVLAFWLLVKGVATSAGRRV